MKAYFQDTLHLAGLFLLGFWLVYWAARAWFGVDVLAYLWEGVRLIAGVSNG